MKIVEVLGQDYQEDQVKDNGREDNDFNNGTTLSTTESVCPICLKRLSAKRVMYGSNVYMEKMCPQHGAFRTILWRGAPSFSGWTRPKIPVTPKNPFSQVVAGCPFDCGLCSNHRQQPCCVLLDVTQRCDLACSFCFASAGVKDHSGDPSLELIGEWYQRLLDAGGPFNIQLSGGEPCLRDDLPEIIALGKSYGFTFFQVNTNGVRLSRDVKFLEKLKQAGLCTVYLQFDGTSDEVYKRIRKATLLERKLQVIEHCAKLEIGVVLVPTLVPGINTGDIGAIIQFAVEHAPTVRGVHFQPVSYFGRYPEPPRDEDRITIPEVIRAIEAQTNGRIKQASFIPPGGENAHCSFHANFVIMQDGELKALTNHETDSCCCSQPQRADEGARKSRLVTAKQWSAPLVKYTPTQTNVLGGWDEFLARARTFSFSISGMAFQDAWNLDLERLRDCYIMQISRDSKIIPFCAYNLTNQQGLSLYRPQ